uniref:Uncharacterized protein n=1 Tax=Siphoviridae sp. ctgmM3 TaxID=2827912 RepID=A0A8S5TK64_9CAUD|nr:MAG TPA: hypothetical protein [Siphoviridae sp. ctgmM3]
MQQFLDLNSISLLKGVAIISILREHTTTQNTRRW